MVLGPLHPLPPQIAVSDQGGKEHGDGHRDLDEHIEPVEGDGPGDALGVLVITSEYSSGTIRASLLAMPRRYPMLIAKGLVFGALVFVIGEAVAFGSFFIGAAIVHSHFPVALSQPGVTRAVIGSGLYLTVLGLFALAIGSLIRHTAGAVTTVIGLVLVIFNLTGLLPYSWGAHIHAYMPTVAGELITQDKPRPGSCSRPGRVSACSAPGRRCC